MVLEFGLLDTKLFPASASLGVGVAGSDTARVENAEGELMTVLSEDSTRKWALILG